MNTKEELRRRRKDAYQKAKALRDSDPHYQALKEQQKQERRAAYRALKEQRDHEKLRAKRERIAEKDKALMALMITATELEKQQQ